MRSIISLLSTATLLASTTFGAPNPASKLAPSLELLRRALKSARSPVPQDVPFTIDEEWCLWNPKGDCLLNDVAVEIYEYMKVDPPEYDYDDYEDDEGVYAYDGDAYEAYLTVLYDLYDVINKHAPYKDYDYDYEKYIADYGDAYCVWAYDGDCWFNDMVKYFDDVWKEPYKKGRAVRRQEEKWSVYATSDGIQSDYAEFAWDLLTAIDANGPLDLDLSGD